MKKKARRFDEGGFLTKEGENEAIDGDTRARARKFVEDAEESPAPKATVKSSSSSSSKPAPAPAPKAESKPKPETKEEYTERMEGLAKKQALEEVAPEDYVPGPGLLKNLLKRGAKATLNTIERKALPSPKSGAPALEGPTPRLSGPSGAAETPRLAAPKVEAKTPAQERAAKGVQTRKANKERRSEEGFNPEEALKARKKAGMKAGGAVRMSASKRADGCAIRGKTRA